MSPSTKAVQPGQEVYVAADIEHAAIARAVAEQAYRAGAFRAIVDGVARDGTVVPVITDDHWVLATPSDDNARGDGRAIR